MTADISILDIEWYPSDPAPDETVEFRVQVRNKGSSTAESVGVVVTVDGEYSHVPPNFDLDPGEQRWTIQTGYNSFDAGVHEGEASVEGHDSQEFTLSVGGELGAVEGRVTTTSGEVPVGSRIYLNGDNIGVEETRTDDNGEFRFEELPPGSYTVEFVDTKYEGFGEKRVSVEGGETASVTGEVEAQTYELDIRGDPISPNFRGDESGEYLYNEELSVTAPSEYDGYEFVEWRSPDGDTVWDDEEYTFTLRSDRTIIAQYSEPGKPDLTVEDIDFSPATPTEEDTVEFTVEIRNRGESAARNFDLEVSTGDGYIKRATNLNLDAGDRGEVPDIGRWNPSPGTHTVEAETNYNRSVDEESYRNNTHREELEVEAVEPDPRADLAIDDLQVSPRSPTEGEEVDVSGYIENHGNRDVSTARLELSVDGETESTTSRSIDGNDRKPITIGEFTVEPGLQTVKVEINPEGEIEETTSSNNVATTSVNADDAIETYDVSFATRGTGEIQVTPPDVVVTDGTETFEAGESVTIEPVNIGDQYQFDRWEGDIPADRRDQNEVTITIEDDARVTAVFTEAVETSIDGSINRIDPIGGEYEAGDEVHTEVVVGNTGTVDHTYFVEYSVVDDSGNSHPRTGRYGSQVTVPEGEFEDVTVEWTVKGSAPEGDYDVEVILWKESSADAATSTLETASEDDVFTVEGDPANKPQLAFESFEIDPNPVTVDEPATVEAEIANTGSEVAEEVTVTIDVDEQEIYSDRIFVEANGTRTVEAEISAFDDPQTVYVSGRTSKSDSEFEASVFEAETSTELTVDAIGAARFDIESLSVSPESTPPDSELTIGFELHNDHDERVSAAVTGEVSAREDAFSSTVYDETVDIDADSSRSIETVVDLGSDVPTGAYDFEVSAVSSNEDSSLGSATNQEALEITSGDKPQLTFESFAVDPNPVPVDEASMVEAEIANTGSTAAEEVTVTIDVAQQELYTDSISVEAGDTETVETEIAAFEEPQTVEVSAATSKTDSEFTASVFEAETSTDLDVEVSGAASFDIQGLSVSPGSTTPESELTIGFEVTNGNDEPLSAAVTGELSATERSFATTVYDETLEMGADATRSIDTAVALDSDVPTGVYDFEVAAVSPSDDSPLGSANAQDALEVTSDAARRVTVEVAAFDAEFNELNEPSFSIRQVDGDVEKQTAINSGSVSIEDVPVGLYEFEAESQRRNQTIGGQMYVTDETDQYRLQFPLLRTLSGVLIGSDGYPISNAEVNITSEDIAETVETNSMGMFSFGQPIHREDLMMDVAAEEWSQTIESTDYFDDHQTIRADRINEQMQSVDEAIEWRDDPVTLEDILLAENRASVSVLTKFDQFRRLADTITTTMAHGVAHGVATGLLDTVEGIGDLVAGIIEFIFSIPEILNNLFEYLAQIWDIFTNIIPILGYIIAALPQILDQFVDSMEADNPHDANGDKFERIRHLQFAVGWYVGYGSLLLLGWYIRAAASLGTILRSSSLVQKAQRYSRNAVGLSDEAERASETATSIYRRSKSTEILDGPPENMAVSSGLVDAMTPATTLGLNSLQPVIRKLIEGTYITSHRAVGKEWLRFSKNEDDDRTLDLTDDDNDDIWTPSGFKELRNPYEDDYDKLPSDLGSGSIGNLKGGVGEAVAIRQIVFGDYDEFDGIGMDSIYGSYYAGDLTDGTSSLITTISLTHSDRDNVFDRLIKDGYNKGEIKQSLDGVNNVDGELDLVRVKETRAGTVVERIYETKSGSSVDLEDQVSKKSKTLDIIKQLDEHPGIDSTKTIEEWGFSLRAFTRGERNDVETVGGTDGPDLKLITASDTELRNTQVLERANIDSDILRLSYSSTQFEKAAEYLFTDKYVDREKVDGLLEQGDDIRSREAARNEIVRERKDKFEFLFDPDYKSVGGTDE